MLESNSRIIEPDLTTPAKDAQSLLKTAATLGGEKAESVRNRGTGLLDTIVAKSEAAQSCTNAAINEVARFAAGYVKENPWRAVAVAAGAGLLLGAVFGRK
jgi:ElaB/YqjD/DUF883 family membrane-anchored ribosome-binding protein